MTMLHNADARRGLRSIIQAIVALIVVGFVGWIIYLLQNETNPLLQICIGLLGIVGMGTLFYGAENVTRAVKLKAGTNGFEAEIGAADAAQSVATAAQKKADTVKP